MSAESRKRLAVWLRWPLALGVLAWLVIPNLDQLKGLLEAGIQWQWIVMAAILRASAMLLGSVRWDLLLQGQGIKLPILRVVRLFATGYVCNFLLPGTVGGDMARAGLVAADSPARRMRGAATVPLDRLLGLLAFIVVGAVAGLAQWPTIPHGLLRTSVLLLVVISACGVTGLAGLLLFRVSWRGRQDDPVSGVTAAESIPPREADPQQRRQKLGHELLYGLALLRESRRSVLIAFAIAAIGHSCLSMTMYCCLRAYPAAEIPAGAISHLWIVPSAEVPAAVLPLPGGVGAREGALSLLYGALSTDSVPAARYREVGVIVAATFSAVSVGLAMLVGSILALTGGWPKRLEAHGE